MQSSLTPEQFVVKWQNPQLNERQAYQMHFAEVCQLVGYETPSPTGKNSHGKTYTFEYGLKKQSGAVGYADVYLEDHFAIEYKAPGKYRDLRSAYDQLLQYRENLHNPPLLIVTDIERWEIHTNWPNTEKQVYQFFHGDIATNAKVQDYLNFIFNAPEKLHPRRNTEQVTAEAAKAFEIIASNMREWKAEPGRIANFLTKVVFCLFAEDINLLPLGPSKEGGIFSEIVNGTYHDTSLFVHYTHQLFKAMADGGDVLLQPIPYFNGSLFNDIRVEELSFEALYELAKASRLNWESVEPAIFGTLFERSLDPAKRSQLGAHYTSREDILQIVEPVLMRPLERQWKDIKTQAYNIRDEYDKILQTSNKRAKIDLEEQLETLRNRMLYSLRNITVLDPACGSGNFLYVALQRLMNMEKEVLFHPVFDGLKRPLPEVHPKQMYGIEKDPIAHALASIVVWIGYLQWRRMNGYLNHPQEPILQDIHENIRNEDAILAYDETGNPHEPQWPTTDIIVGNPPFLGSKEFLTAFNEKYTRDLRRVYSSRLSGNVDLVVYWFQKSLQIMRQSPDVRVGLVSTSKITNIQNRGVIEKIAETGNIFNVITEKEWHDGKTAVRVSIVCFDRGLEDEIKLNQNSVTYINPDFSSGVSTTFAHILNQRPCIIGMGTKKYGPFEIDEKLAREFLSYKNASGLDNRDVIKRWANGQDVASNNISKWIIDFHEGGDKPLEIARLYEKPFQYVESNVKPMRMGQRNPRLEKEWWLFEAPRHEIRNELSKLERYIVTVYDAARRFFVWLDSDIVPDQKLVVFATDSEYIFGVLHSKFHEIWSIKSGGKLGKGNTDSYTIGAIIDTFPFPFIADQEDTSSQSYQAIVQAARQLHTEREAWLNPPRLRRSQLKDRTLTNLYNALAVWRGTETMRVTSDAANFAPILDELHIQLDKAVCSAYDWHYNILGSDEGILSNLLALNANRAAYRG